jgi:hypothetical protein
VRHEPLPALGASRVLAGLHPTSSPQPGVGHDPAARSRRASPPGGSRQRRELGHGTGAAKAVRPQPSRPSTAPLSAALHAAAALAFRHHVASMRLSRPPPSRSATTSRRCAPRRSLPSRSAAAPLSNPPDAGDPTVPTTAPRGVALLRVTDLPSTLVAPNVVRMDVAGGLIGARLWVCYPPAPRSA